MQFRKKFNIIVGSILIKYELNDDIGSTGTFTLLQRAKKPKTQVNIVTNKKDIPHAILIRAIQPEVGIDVMLGRRKQKELVPRLSKGPGSLCQALGIHRAHNGMVLNGSSIWLEDRGAVIAQARILISPRIGIDYAEEDALKPWRFLLID